MAWPTASSLIQHSREGSAEVLKPDNLKYLCSSRLFPFKPSTEYFLRVGKEASQHCPAPACFELAAKEQILDSERCQWSLYLQPWKRSKNINWSIHNSGALSRPCRWVQRKALFSGTEEVVPTTTTGSQMCIPSLPSLWHHRKTQGALQDLWTWRAEEAGWEEISLLHRSFCGTSQPWVGSAQPLIKIQVMAWR